VISGLDTLPKSILYYRQQLQWLGGIGIVVIAVAILPMLGVGGMQIYRAETPGPMKDSKITPRITETANVLFKIYVALTAVCALAYWIAGMSLFDAICHSFSTVAIGGFSTHDASIGFFDSGVIMAICTFFMVVSGINFALHYAAWHDRQLSFTGPIPRRGCIWPCWRWARLLPACTYILAAPTAGVTASGRAFFNWCRL